MDMQHTAMDRIRMVAGHVRVLADLMLAGPDLQDVDRGAFAQVLQDLAVRLERALEEIEQSGEGPLAPREDRP